MLPLWKVLFATSFLLALALGQDEPVIKQTPSDGIVRISNIDMASFTSLDCKTEKGGVFSWFQLDEAGREEPVVPNEDHQIEGGHLKLRIATLQDGETFRCKLDDNETFADFEIEKSIHLFWVTQFPKSVSVLEGDNLNLTCKIANKTAVSYDNITIRWFMWEDLEDVHYQFNQRNCSDNPKWIPLTEKMYEGEKEDDGEESKIPSLEIDSNAGFDSATLMIRNANEQHRRAFKCTASVLGGTDDGYTSCAATFVRAKDRYAALWPFLGIVVEVAVLCLTIYICERKIAKENEAAEEEEASKADSSNLKNGKAKK